MKIVCLFANHHTRVKAYKRAKENALFLIKDASKYGTTILVAHAFHNKVIIDYMKKKGWKIVLNEGKRYGAVNILAKKLS